MKNENHKIKDASKAGLGLIVTSLLDVGSDAGAELAKESFTHVASDVTTDILSSIIPGVGGAVSSYKRMRTERNLKRFAEELYKRNTALIKNLQKQTEENRAKLDELLFYILEITIKEHQEEKITFMVNGYLNLTAHEDFTADFVML